NNRIVPLLVFSGIKINPDVLNLESAVEHGFVGNPGVPDKASFAVNGHSLNKNDNAAGCVGIFHTSM
ncbi:MAG: hypothetical protein KZQ79_13055, partial [Candidatus Thiodiazotropha sp. (ex Lucinoma borealis)]|nr:hypothetical protein [Candidatus Thiodiazotropha sp. (ex Lucinoma borealis)]